MANKPHHIEIDWSRADPNALRAHCIDCDEYIDSYPLPNDWHALSAARIKLRAILEQDPCWPERRGAMIIGGREDALS